MSERFKKIKLKYVLGGLVLLLLILGVGVGLFLSSQSQDVRQQASGPGTYPTCAGGLTYPQRACDTFRSWVQCQTNGLFSASTQCAANEICSGGNCIVSTGSSPGTGTTPQPTPTSGQCVSAGGSCSIGGDGSSTCCGNLVCQNGVTGQLRCEDPGTTDLCPGGGTCGGAGGWLGFRCNQLTNGQCLENPQTFNDYASAAAYAGGCGQVDEVCVGGSNNRNLCGSFQIFSSTCGGNPSVPPSVPPSVAPTPSPTPSPEITPSPEVSPSPTPLPAVCGGACSFTSQCPQDHTCNNGVCQLTACVNGASCSDDMCRVTACGSSCSTNTDCPNNHTCNNNTCVLNACINGSVCTSDLCRITGCGNSCSNNGECPNDHTCNNNRCELTACVNGANCDSNRCYVVNNPTPVPTTAPVGCNDPCVNNSDCQASNHICVDTVNGRRCRYEGNITSDTCSGAPVVVAQGQPTPVATPTVLPTAGSNDIIMAIGAGAAAIILGIVGFLML